MGDRDDVAAARALLAEALGRTGRDGPTLGLVAQSFETPTLRDVIASGKPPLPAGVLRDLAWELALRGRPFDADDAIVRPIARGHDALRLPPVLLPIETSFPQRVIGYGASGSRGMGWPRQSGGPELEPLVASAMVRTDDRAAASIDAAVRAWRADSNGRQEVAVFRLDGVSGRHATESTLRALGLEAIPAAGPLEIATVAPEAALGTLFSAAHGGAYGGLGPDPLARTLAWTSLAGLVGAAPDRPVWEVEAAAMASGFVAFSRTPFFYDVFHDLGLAVVGPSGDRLAVLAATDTD